MAVIAAYTGKLLKRSTAGVLTYTAQTVENPTVTVSKNGGSFGAASSTAARIGSTNEYKLTVAAADVDTNGPVTFMLDGSTDDIYLHAYVCNYDPADIVGAVWDELIDTTHTTTNSAGRFLRLVYGALLGKTVWTKSTNVQVVRNTADDATLKTLTYAETDTSITRTPS